MADLNLTQAEADTLIALEKYKVDSRLWRYPYMGGRVNIPPCFTGQRRGVLPWTCIEAA